MASLRRQLGLLIAGALLLGALVCYPARLIWGPEAGVQSAVAMLLCLVPATVTLGIGRWALTQSADRQLVAILGGMGVRMVFVLGSGALLYTFVDELHSNGFWVWLIVFYLSILALELTLLLTGRPQENAGA